MTINTPALLCNNTQYYHVFILKKNCGGITTKKKKKNGDNTPGQHSGKRKWVVTGQVPEIGHQQPPLLWSDLGDVVELLQIDFTHTLFTAIMTHGRQLKFVTVNGWQDALTHSSVCYSTYAQSSFPPFSSRSLLLIMYVGKGGLGSLNEHLWIFIYLFTISILTPLTLFQLQCFFSSV